MRHCSGGQSDQDEVLDNCCHVNSALEVLSAPAPRVMILHIDINKFQKINIIVYKIFY